MTGRASVAAIGEGSFHHYADCSRERLTREAHNVTGFIAVSPKVKEGLISEYKVSASKIAVFPNGVDLSCFRPRDRRVMREKYGLPLDKFLVAFVGHFNDHKGVLRVSEAVKGLEGVGAVYLGSGGLEPDPSSAFFCGVLSHARVPEVLSAADLFVLPTLFEGSCNAIVEAMACGLPIVSSDGEFNDDVLDPSMSIRVNPRDVVAIREAIRRFQKDEALRRRAATCARERAKRFDLATRVQKILTWIGELTAGFSQPVVARDGGP
jgi:glycosyltransferase involved in cell wall biosynthesis